MKEEEEEVIIRNPWIAFLLFPSQYTHRIRRWGWSVEGGGGGIYL